MADTFRFDLVTPERQLISADVASVIVPGAEGDFMVLPGHAPFISMLRPGLLTVPQLDGQERKIFVRGGFAEAGPDRLIVLAQQAIKLEDFDLAKLKQEIQWAEEDLADAQDEDARLLATDTLERLKTMSEVVDLR